jgi:hypothetical protein
MGYVILCVSAPLRETFENELILDGGWKSWVSGRA